MSTIEIMLAHKWLCIFDEADADYIFQHSWTLNRGGKGQVHARMTRKEGRPRKYMHVYLMQPDPGFVVDHVNGNGLDNRRENLRYATIQENARNHCLNKAIFASPYKGVTLSRSRRYSATITVDGKRIWLGTWDEEKEAAKAYDEAAIEHFGEFACTNFDHPDSQRRM